MNSMSNISLIGPAGSVGKQLFVQGIRTMW